MSDTATVQSSFTDPIERSREVVERCAKEYDPDYITLAVSGGTDSVVAADVFARIGPEYGLEPDSVTHINTGTSIPQSELTARIIADIHDLEFKKQGYRNPQDSIAARILENGWPGAYGGSPVAGGHGLEWANRKDKPMNQVYVDIAGMQVWVSGARKLESKKRSGNVPDSGIEQDKPRRAWCSVIGGWTSEEKKEYIRKRGLPVSEAYLTLGFSGECTACAFDERGLLTNIDLLCPELSYAIRSLALWVYQRVKRGDVDLAPKRLCWGWEPDESLPDGNQQSLSGDTAQAMVGCDEDSCSTRENPSWVLQLPEEQLVDRDDVLSYWDTSELPQRFPV